MKAFYKMVFDSEEDDDTETCSSVTDRMDSDATIDSSTESDTVSKWVDHELRKIKRNLSKEGLPRVSKMPKQPGFADIDVEIHIVIKLQDFLFFRW